MSGKFCPTCLWKYMRSTCRREVPRYQDSAYIATRTAILLALPTFWLDIQRASVYNYKYISGDLNGLTPFTPTQAPSAGLKRTGRRPPAPPGGDRSVVPQQCLLRSERSGAGEVRDAAQRPGRGASSCRRGRGLRPVPPGVLRHAGPVRARRLAGSVAAQARTE